LEVFSQDIISLPLETDSLITAEKKPEKKKKSSAIESDITYSAKDSIVMVGNDVGEDMIAGQLGRKTLLLTVYIINKKDEDISVYANGSFDRLKEFREKL
jgi:hypothetical protein